jgi:hypothetical protein
MRNWRGSARFCLALALALAASNDARAQLLVATTPGDSPAVSRAELAYASGAGVPVTWLSLRVERGPVAVVAALPDDAVVDPALDAWLAALERTASPNVLLPTGATGCKNSERFVHVSWPRGPGVLETALVLGRAEDVQAALDEQELSLEAALPEAARYVVWSWPQDTKAQTTRTLRVQGGAAPLTLDPGGGFPVLVNALTRGSEMLPDELKDDQLRVTFVSGKPSQTDYLDRLLLWLDERPEPLLEMRARGPVFDWSIYDDQVSLAPLVRAYAVQAAKELPRLDVDACSDQLRALRDPEAPAPSACGEARDAELALSAVGSEQVTLQRYALSARIGLTGASSQGGGEPNAPLLRAERWDGTQCESDAGTIVVEPPRQGGGSSGPTGTDGNTTVVVEETVVTDPTPHSEVSCGSSTQSEQGYDASDRDDSCSGNSSSSSSSSSDDSCSGNSSSSSSSSSDDSCSGNSSSSSSSSSDDSGCSSDSSTSRDRDGGCDSSTSDENGGYDGDTCTNKAAPGAERTQKTQAGLSGPIRPRRLKTSLWTVAFVAVMLPIRRRKRRL